MVALLSKVPGGEDGHVQSRLFLDGARHSVMAGECATCTAACSRVEESLVAKVMRTEALSENVFKVLHPGGVLPISVEEGHRCHGLPACRTLAFVRTARYLHKGKLFVTEDLEVDLERTNGDG